MSYVRLFTFPILKNPSDRKSKYYSAKWMENSDVSNLNHETLEDQYEKVKYETNTSTVCQFGDVDNISKMSVSNFQGKKRKIELVGLSDPIPDECGSDAVPSPDVEKISLERLMQLDSGLEEEERIQGRMNFDWVVAKQCHLIELRCRRKFIGPLPSC